MSELIEAAAYRTQDEAKDAARRLVEHGIGASVAKVTAVDEATGIEVAGYQVNVLPDDRHRAQEVLGIVAVTSLIPEPEAPPLKPEKTPTPWLRIFLIWLVAMIVIPATAFFLTVWLGSSGP